MESTPSRPPVVFISYAREDEAAARRLRIALKRNGAAPWQDRTHLLGGEEWKPRIRAAIREADYFLPLLSHVSVNKRGFVQSEVREALEELDRLPPDSTYILPCRLDDCQPRHARLADLTWIDLFPEWRKGFARIKLKIELRQQSPFNRAKRPPAPAPSAPSPSSLEHPRESRVSLSLSPQALEAVEQLRERLAAGSRADVLRQALFLLDAAARERAQGRDVTVLRDGLQIPLPLRASDA